MESDLVRRLVLGNRSFEFHLCRKPNHAMEPVEVDHWWMPVTPLYGQRQGGSPPAHNHSEILRFYWAVVEEREETQERPARERWLLASLAPKVRAEGSRTIFADAFLKKRPSPQQDADVSTLETMLSNGFDQQCTREQFHHQGRDALGRTEFPAGLQTLHAAMTAELLDGPCQRLAAGETETARTELLAHWTRWMRTIGRRSGHTEEKIVLDALSYEARAAFHDCYSVAWCCLIPLFAREVPCALETASFLQFWHTNRIDSETGASLFHGHVLGLHPGTGLFMLTETGRLLMGEWLEQPESVERFGRLLNGLLVALFDYARRREEAASARRR